MKVKFRVSVENRCFQKEFEAPCLTAFFRLSVGNKFVIFPTNLKTTCWNEKENYILVKHLEEGGCTLLTDFGNTKAILETLINDPAWQELVF